MSDRLKTRWGVIGIVWTAALIMTYWNFIKIETIEKAREKKEIYLMDERFWHRNASNISQIMEKRTALIQEVESLKLGVFEFEDNLKNLARKLGLRTVKLVSQAHSDQDGVLPVQISFQSNFSQATQWLDRVKLELPYAQIESIKIVADKPANQAEFVVSIYYRYNLSSTETTS